MRAFVRAAGAIQVLSCALAVGCGGAERVFTCTSSAECDVASGGFCQPTHECSHAAAGCPSGQRYGRYAAEVRRGRCVPADLTTSLRLRLAFDEGDGATSADLAGNGFTATLVGAARWTDGRWGGALGLDGIGSRATIAGESMRFGRSSFSAFAWVRSQDRDGAQSRVLASWSAGSYFYLNFGNGRPAVEASDASGTFWSTTSAAAEIGDGAWHHLGYVCDRERGSIALYVDGEIAAVRTGIDSAGTVGDESSNQVTIGAQDDANSALALAGAVDEVWVFSRALAAAEIAALSSPGSVAR